MTTLFTKSTKINGLKLIREPATDKRGYLDRLFCLKSLEADFDSRKIIQINHSFTEKEGTIRGASLPKATIRRVENCYMPERRGF